MMRLTVLVGVCLSALYCEGQSAPKQRARQIGIPFDGNTGKLNAITDVLGLEVGYSTIIKDTGKLGKGPVRTGVTVILPKGKIVIVATDAPLLPGQLKLIAKRIVMGIARTGSIAHNGSGDIFLALSTAAPEADEKTGKEIWSVIKKSKIDPVYKATVEATEEAIINALVAAEDMTGVNNNTFFAIPHERLKQALKKYNRLTLK